MGDTSVRRHQAIRHSQNELLYSGVKFAAFASLGASVVVATTFHSIVNQSMTYMWMAIVFSVYAIRVFDSYLFYADSSADQRTHHWSSRFYWLAILSSLAWASSIWLMFPENDPAYQVLLVLTIGGVAGGALASLPYDNKLSLVFQLILFLSVELKLLITGTPFSIELALYSLFVFGFLISCGNKVGTNYVELLRLKQDSQDNNIALIKTTEQMAQMGYWQWKLKSRTVDLSENLAKLLRFDNRVVSIEECIDQIHPDDRHVVRSSLSAIMEDENTEGTAIEYRLRLGDDPAPRHMRQLIKRMTDTDGTQSLFGSVQDISATKMAELKMYNMAYFDSLTQLANRAHFHEHLERHTVSAKKESTNYSIIYIDLDNFKGVNDSYGHECGDRYLSAFADHLRASISRTHFISRLGGDEFCILVQGFSDKAEINKIAQDCLAFTEHTIQIENHRIHPKLSMGISMFPEHGNLPDEIVKRADIAMYHAKNLENQSVAFFEESLEHDAIERVRLEADLRKALADNHFELWYQPKMDIRNNTIAGVEALIRWRHPEKGLIPPDLFITTAERVGVIKDIGEWVVVTACKQLKSWNDEGYQLQMAVNISSDHFASAGFTDFVIRSVENSGILPTDLEVEITESLSRDPEVHTRVCKELRTAGVRVAIDDFGTGYSSLSILGELEVDTLKIDRSFIQHLAEDENTNLMVKAITDLALGLGYECVAEGVETVEQLNFLKDLNCPYVQGYFFSPPIQAEILKQLLASAHQRAA